MDGGIDCVKPGQIKLAFQTKVSLYQQQIVAPPPPNWRFIFFIICVWAYTSLDCSISWPAVSCQVAFWIRVIWLQMTDEGRIIIIQQNQTLAFIQSPLKGGFLPDLFFFTDIKKTFLKMPGTSQWVLNTSEKRISAGGIHSPGNLCCQIGRFQQQQPLVLCSQYSESTTQILTREQTSLPLK